jgi:hypothetical protein
VLFNRKGFAMTTTHPTCETCKHWAQDFPDLKNDEGVCDPWRINGGPVKKTYYCAMHSEVWRKQGELS